ncbi:hypothetical protein DICVIV_10885 [Dictyocaulus viviparus]|uniref:Uncharacterized protein n=1 Tax=Dictyocaulus viviparus TaxID=29172 RepID=A0A0D8XEN0_DICVI|nr:hypothetical protein DICVIV_10885 [Dictyocaulus viviparus]
MVVNCLVVKGSITKVCTPMRDNQCEMQMYVKDVPMDHLFVSGSITTTNILMSNWSREMWQVILGRVLRSLKSGPLASSFYKASIAVN